TAFYNHGSWIGTGETKSGIGYESGSHVREKGRNGMILWRTCRIRMPPIRPDKSRSNERLKRWTRPSETFPRASSRLFFCARGRKWMWRKRHLQWAVQKAV